MLVKLSGAFLKLFAGDNSCGKAVAYILQSHGLPLGSFLIPQLTTIVQPVHQLAQRGVEMLIASIEEGGEARHETVPFSLCSRESTRKI